MFGLFKKDPIASLQKKREKLLKQAYEMSHVDRQKSDALTEEAEKIALEIEKLQKS